MEWENENGQNLTESDRITPKEGFTDEGLTESDRITSNSDETYNGVTESDGSSIPYKSGGDGIYKDWVTMTENREQLPTKDNPIDWRDYKKAVRGWYTQRTNFRSHESTRVRNHNLFALAVSHFKSMGLEVQPVKGGTFRLLERDSKLYDSSTGEVLDVENSVELTTGGTTGWDTYEPLD